MVRRKRKYKNASQHQDIFMEYWWPDYADPYSWFINLLYTESPPYFNLSYYSDKTLDGMINKVAAGRDRPDRRRAAVQGDAGADPWHRADLVPVQLELPVRDAEQLHRAPGQPRVPERGVRLDHLKPTGS